MERCACLGVGCNSCFHMKSGSGWVAARAAPRKNFEKVSFTTSELCHPNGRVSFPKGFGLSNTDTPAIDSGYHLPSSYAVLDDRARNTWEYPSSEDYPDREYQLEIASVALFQNTLVALPTGLGKTFIAAVVMYNYYRCVIVN